MIDPLLALADRARTEPVFLAYLLQAFAVAHSLDDAGLADALGCTPADLPLVRLCRALRTTAEGFREDIELIATRFRLDPGRLRAILKQAGSIVCLRAAGREAHESGYLMAARDRIEEQHAEGS
jgi:hypothetical protein